MPETVQQTESRERLFRRMVIWFTALSLTAAYGWLAGFVRQPDGDLAFRWRWMVLVWAFIGVASTVYFWRKIWPPASRIRATRGGIIKGVIVLALPGIWWLIFPLRSQSGEHLRQVLEGLTAAILVMTCGAWMIFRLGKAFQDDK